MTDFKIPDEPAIDALWDRMGEQVATKGVRYRKSLEMYSDGGRKVMGWATPRVWSARGYATRSKCRGYSE